MPWFLACAVEEGSCSWLPWGSPGEVQIWSVIQFSFEMLIIGVVVSESSRCNLPDSAGFCWSHRWSFEGLSLALWGHTASSWFTVSFQEAIIDQNNGRREQKKGLGLNGVFVGVCVCVCVYTPVIISHPHSFIQPVLNASKCSVTGTLTVREMAL